MPENAIAFATHREDPDLAPFATATREKGGSTGSGLTPNGKVILYTQVSNDSGYSGVEIKVKKTGCGCNDEKQTGISEETMERVKAAMPIVVEYVQKNLHQPDARNVLVNLTNLTLRYTDTPDGEENILLVSNIEDVVLRTLLLDLAKDVAIHQTTDPDTPSNRPMNGSKPLEIPPSIWPAWYSMHRISAAEYATNHHQDLDTWLRYNGLETNADEAIPKIKAAQNFINLFAQGLQARLTTKQEELKELEKIPAHNRNNRHKLQQQIKQLEDLVNKLNPQNALDTMAIFRSVPYADHDLLGLDVADQMTRAMLSKQDMSDHLTSNIGSISEGRVFKNTPDTAFITAYSQDKADLLIHDCWKYEGSVEDRGGEKRGPSMEEFIVYNILNLNADNCVEEALTSLALPKDGDVRAIALQVLEGTRRAVKDSYKTDVEKIEGRNLDLQTQINELFP